MKFYLLIITLLIGSTMNSQDLKSHQWNNRVILVLSNDQDSADFKKQIADLKNSSTDCAERKLILYQITPSEVRLDFFDEQDSKKWNTAAGLYTEFMSEKDTFKFILIGLDGGVKEERSHIIATEELFSIIDAMSMRKAEMKKSN